MANSIDLATVFLRLVDAIYKRASVTVELDAVTQDVPFIGADTVKVMKLGTVGLGNYSRTNGYPKGDITATWEALKLTIERGREFVLDRMDNEESLGLVLGNVIDQWMTEHVAPEIDATRFAKYASTPGVLTTAGATLDKDTILPAIDAASLAMDEAEVPTTGRMLFISSMCERFLRAAISRQLANENTADRRLTNIDELTIRPVPQGRFFTKIKLDAGGTSNAGGFTKDAAGGAKDINFMIVHRSAILQPVKLNQVKYFSPEINQTSDGHKWQYRLYHDAFVYDNKQKGVYVHTKA